MATNLLVEARDDGPLRTVTVAGHLFLPDTAPLIATLAAALSTAPHHVVVCDVSALQTPLSEHLLIAFPAALRRSGGWPHTSLHLAAPNPLLAARLTHLHMDRYLPVHPTLDAALASATTETALAARHLTLPPEPVSLHTVRTAVTDLWPAEASIDCAAATLVANELAANAITHVARPFAVSLALARSRMLVAVSDPSRHEPVLRPIRRPSAVNGRGMHVVATLSQDWGVRLVHPKGKTVWASLTAPAPPDRYEL